MKMLKKLPYPIAGLALGLASFGNLLTESAPTLKLILGLIAAVILLGLTLKALLLPASLKEAFHNPAVAGTLMTFPMAMIILSTYILKAQPLLAKIVWFTGIALGLLILILMSLRYLVRFDIKKVFASYFVPFVGLGVVSMTSKAMGYPLLGQLAFWLGLILYPIILLMVTYRYVRVKNIPPPAKPAIAIYAAPASLLLAGYLAAFDQKSQLVATGLFIVALLMTLIGFINALPQLKGPFLPSISAFTFPFVISAVATRMMNGYLTASGKPSSLVQSLFWIEFALAGAFLLYTFIRYLIFLSTPTNA